jgi:hypothetical protein
MQLPTRPKDSIVGCQNFESRGVAVQNTEHMIFQAGLSETPSFLGSTFFLSRHIYYTDAITLGRTSLTNFLFCHTPFKNLPIIIICAHSCKLNYT